MLKKWHNWCRCVQISPYIRVIRSRIMKSAGRTAYIWWRRQTRNRVLQRKPNGNRHLGRRNGRKMEDKTEMGFNETGWRGVAWTGLIWVKIRPSASGGFLSTLFQPVGSIRCRNFLTGRGTVSLSKSTVRYGIAYSHSGMAARDRVYHIYLIMILLDGTSNGYRSTNIYSRCL
jgi:hypothetical protein